MGERTARPGSHSLVKALRAVPDFAPLTDETLLDMAGVSTNLLWRAGSMVFQKGAEGEGLYVLLSGEVVILDEVDGREVEIARVGPGGFFGELSLMLDTLHTKSARAETDTELMTLPRDCFTDLVEANEDLALLLQRKVDELTSRPSPVGSDRMQS